MSGDHGLHLAINITPRMFDVHSLAADVQCGTIDVHSLAADVIMWYA